MSPKMDMSQEKEPKVKKLLPEGDRIFTIIACEEKVSKSGNNMFVFSMKDEETSYVDEVFAISTQGKRWLLKQILSACGVKAGQDGIYDWEIKDVINKRVLCSVEHEPNEYINRNGEKITTTQHRISKVTEIAWDE